MNIYRDSNYPPLKDQGISTERVRFVAEELRKQAGAIRDASWELDSALSLHHKQEVNSRGGADASYGGGGPQLEPERLPKAYWTAIGVLRRIGVDI